MEETLDNELKHREYNTKALRIFIGCLSNALQYIHSKNVKHMDIKPQNLLIRNDGFQVDIYIADFGIARAYKCADESLTDSPVSFTRLYAAPEVAAQDPRSFPADIFSLGCVFMEMIAVIATTPEQDEYENLRKARCQKTDSSYHTNIEAVTQWYDNLATRSWSLGLSVVCSILHPSRMLCRILDKRVTARTLKSSTVELSCHDCGAGPRPFEAA
jgi:serine/threonine protein kinase